MGKLLLSESEKDSIRKMYGISESEVNEYDIYDDESKSFMNELISDGGDEILQQANIDTSNEDSILNSVSNCEVCKYSDINSMVDNKFGKIIQQQFKENSSETIQKVKESLNGLINHLKTLDMKGLKNFYREMKSKKDEIKPETQQTTEGNINEIFGTTMAIVTIGSFAMPALVLTIAFWVIVGLIGLWLIKSVLCAFNISFERSKGCSFKQAEWGKCK
jgi:hypothetical protein